MNLNDFEPRIRESIKKRFHSLDEIKFLQEEASTRKYYLLREKDRKEVLCVDQEVNQEFVEISQFFEEVGIRASRILSIDSDSACLYQSYIGSEDFSNLELEEYKKRIPQLIEILIQFQNLDPPSFVSSRSFDYEKLKWEVDLTLEKFEAFKKYFSLKTSIPPEMTEFFDVVCKILDRYPKQVFCHRDFHCRNILRDSEDQPVLIDFQDARMGCPQYDLASLLYDAYYPLPREFRVQMLAEFMSKSQGSDYKFKETYYLQALQRSFKALGTYFRMIVDYQKWKFATSIWNCLGNIEEIIQLGLFPDFLFVFVCELQNDLRKVSEFRSK